MPEMPSCLRVNAVIQNPQLFCPLQYQAMCPQMQIVQKPVLAYQDWYKTLDATNWLKRSTRWLESCQPLQLWANIISPGIQRVNILSETWWRLNSSHSHTSGLSKEKKTLSCAHWPPLWSSGQSSWLHNVRCIVFPVRYELNLYMLCRRK
jgi:hypothetical protein